MDCQVIFTFFDEANVADWKGRDLRQANSIPNIDLLLLTIRKVKYLLLHLFWIVLPPKKNPAHDPAHNQVSRIAIQNLSNAESVAWFYLLVILLFITRLRVQNRDSEENYSNNSYRPVLWRVFFPIKNKIYICCKVSTIHQIYFKTAWACKL